MNVSKGSKLRKMFEKCCVHVDAPGTLDDADGSAPPAVPLVAAAPGRHENIKGRAAFLEQLRHKGAVSADAQKHDLDRKHRIVAQARAFATHRDLPGAGDGLALCRWWHTEGARCFSDLLPGVRVLLSVPAGNAELERCFGKASEHLTAMRKHQRLHQAFLGHNAPVLRLPGYTHIEPPADYDVNEEDGE